MKSQKSLAERALHALLYEGIAIAICAPFFALLFNRSLLEMGSLSVLLSTTAMLWNMVYNMLFDKCWPAERVVRTLKVRILHALGFEGGFIFIGVLVVAGFLGIGWYDAFMLEIGFFLFFLPYTLVFNWAYDKLRGRLLARRVALKQE